MRGAPPLPQAAAARVPVGRRRHHPPAHTPRTQGRLGIRLSLIAYCIVAVRKTFLDATVRRLLSDPEAFRGIL